jgi:hypothetical protein
MLSWVGGGCKNNKYVNKYIVKVLLSLLKNVLVTLQNCISIDLSQIKYRIISTKRTYTINFLIEGPSPAAYIYFNQYLTLP